MRVDKNPKSNERYMVPAVEQAARVLFCLADADASHLSLTEICSKADIHKSQAFSILHTLQKFGLAQRNIDGKGYSLGPGLITLSRKVLDNFNVPRLAEPFLEELAKKSGSTATLGLIVDNQIVVVAKHEGGHEAVGRLGQGRVGEEDEVGLFPAQDVHYNLAGLAERE